jgi:hypothetical protein
VGTRYALHHLGRLPAVVVARERRMWGLYRPMQTNPGRSPWAQDAGVVMYYMLVPLTVCGFVLLRRRRVQTWPLVAPFVLVALAAALVYGYLRFRHPAEIPLVILAGVAIEQLWLRLRARRPASSSA